MPLGRGAQSSCSLQSHMEVGTLPVSQWQMRLVVTVWPAARDTVEGASLVALMVKNPAMQETWVAKIPWRREWLPTPVFLPGEYHGQKSLVGYSSWGHKESKKI